MELKSKFIFSNLTAIISNYMFYADNESEIDDWLEKYNCERTGMVIKFCDENTMMLFMIKWVN